MKLHETLHGQYCRYCTLGLIGRRIIMPNMDIVAYFDGQRIWDYVKINNEPTAYAHNVVVEPLSFEEAVFFALQRFIKENNPKPPFCKEIDFQELPNGHYALYGNDVCRMYDFFGADMNKTIIFFDDDPNAYFEAKEKYTLTAVTYQQALLQSVQNIAQKQSKL